MKTIVLDAGHGYNTSGKRCADGTREWYLNSRIASMVGDMLAREGYRVIRVDDVTGVKDISLLNRVYTANKANADYYISIHHNAGLNGRKGGGTVVYWYSNDSRRAEQAARLYTFVVKRTGLVGNRAQKVINNPFYVLRKTKMPALLIENGFMDGPDDLPIIKSKEHAEQTALGIYEFVKSLG